MEEPDSGQRQPRTTLSTSLGIARGILRPHIGLTALKGPGGAKAPKGRMALKQGWPMARAIPYSRLIGM